MVHAAVQADPWAGTLAVACHTHMEAVDRIRASVVPQVDLPCAVAQASAHHGVAVVAPLALAAHRSHDAVGVVRAAAAHNPMVAQALQVAACARMVAVHSPAEVDHSLGEVAAAAHVARDVPLAVANEVAPFAPAAWKHQGDCHSRSAVVAALLPWVLHGGAVVGCSPCRELQLELCSPPLAVVVHHHAVVVAPSVREVVENGCDFADAGGDHHCVAALLDNLGEAQCLDAASVAPLAADGDHEREEARGAEVAVAPSASVEAP